MHYGITNLKYPLIPKTTYTVHPMYKKNKKALLFAYSFRNNP